MSNTIRNGHSLDVTIPSGQSVAITTYTGTYSASVLYGVDKGAVLATASEGGDTFGPYASGAVIRITAGVDSEVAFDVGASPSVTASQKAPSFAVDASGNVTGLVGPDGVLVPGFPAKTPVLLGASAGDSSEWLPNSFAPERFLYQLDSGSTSTTFSVDVSADGVSSLGQAFTGTWSSSTVAEITFPVMFSNPQAKYFRWNVVSGGPLSVYRGA